MPISSDSFEQQYTNTHLIDVSGGQVEAIDVQPERLAGEIPILYASGWGERLTTQAIVIRELYNLGHRVIAVHHTVTTANSKTYLDCPMVERQKAEMLCAAVKYFGVRQVDVISHSEGSINCLIAASMCSGLFRNFVLVAPIGLIGPDNALRLMTGFIWDTLVTACSSKHDFQVMRHIMLPSLGQAQEHTVVSYLPSRQELSAITRYNLYQLLQKVRQSGHHIAVLTGRRDAVVPLSRLQRYLAASARNNGNNPSKQLYDLDAFEVIPGGHHAIFTHTTDNVRHALRLLDAAAHRTKLSGM